MAIETRVAQFSSLALRAFSYFFLRWALLPLLAPAIFTLMAIYAASFISSILKNNAEEEVLVIKETTVRAEDAPTANGTNVLVIEQLEVEETLPPSEKPSRFLSTLLTGRPSPKSFLLSLTTFLINVACVGMVADRLYAEHNITASDLSFVRVGYVSDTEAKLLIREPDQTKMPVSVEIHIKDPRPPFDNPLWQTAGGVRWTGNETDYTATVTIQLRHSSQRTYEWRTSNNHSGEFTAAPAPGRMPTLHDGKFTFLSTSCIVSRLPYNPTDHPLAIPGMRYMAEALPSLGAQFMLFLGDFIYVDVPRWWGKGIEDYRQKYRQVYASPDWSGVGQNLSWIHVLDDHDIANDWSANNTGVYNAAIEPWRDYHTAVNPPPAKRAGLSIARAGATYFEFVQGPASFFLLDTRSYRSDNDLPQNNTDKTMLGAEQLEDFLDYLHRPEPKGVKWKIIASSVPFTKNWHVNGKDTWGGFLTERQKILEAMWDVSARGVGVVIISGDRHEFAATKFPPPPGSKWSESATVYEFSASPLSQFYSPIQTYWQSDDHDVPIKYVNKGNSKFGALTIESIAEGDKSSLKYRLFVDGVETWNTVIITAEQKKAPPSGSFWGKLIPR